MKLTIKGNAPKDYDEIINHEDGTKWIKESRVIEILKGLKMEEPEHLNLPVSEQNAKIQAIIDVLTDGGKHE